MTHPHEDDLLLLAYGELAEPATAELERHLADCAPCRTRFSRMGRGRVALEWATQRRARPVARVRRTALAGLAVAAVLAIVLLRGHGGTHAPQLSLTVPRYAAPELAPIDSLLTRLEKEKPYAIP
jgi:anti-sigma factor RsiW